MKIKKIREVETLARDLDLIASYNYNTERWEIYEVKRKRNSISVDLLWEGTRAKTFLKKLQQERRNKVNWRTFKGHRKIGQMAYDLDLIAKYNGDLRKWQVYSAERDGIFLYAKEKIWEGNRIRTYLKKVRKEREVRV